MIINRACPPPRPDRGGTGAEREPWNENPVLDQRKGGVNAAVFIEFLKRLMAGAKGLSLNPR